jgi:toxin ParE1/3/4
MRVEIGRLARADLQSIHAYIAQDNPIAAQEVIQLIRDQVLMLGQHPRCGRLGRIEGTRELVIKKLPYIACYIETGDGVKVLRVLHGAKKWPGSVTG